MKTFVSSSAFPAGEIVQQNERSDSQAEVQRVVFQPGQRAIRLRLALRRCRWRGNERNLISGQIPATDYALHDGDDDRLRIGQERKADSRNRDHGRESGRPHTQERTSCRTESDQLHPKLRQFRTERGLNIVYATVNGRPSSSVVNLASRWRLALRR